MGDNGRVRRPPSSRYWRHPPWILLPSLSHRLQFSPSSLHRYAHFTSLATCTECATPSCDTQDDQATRPTRDRLVWTSFVHPRSAYPPLYSLRHEPPRSYLLSSRWDRWQERLAWSVLNSSLAQLDTDESPDSSVAIQKDYLSALAGAADDDTYEPQIYLLRDDVNCEVVLVIRGSQSLSDIKVDLEGSLGELELPRLEGEGTETYRAHEGILTAARTLLNPETSPLFVKLKAALESHPGYALVLVGHSLGGGIVSSPVPSTSIISLTNSSPGLPRRRPLRYLQPSSALFFFLSRPLDDKLNLRSSPPSTSSSNLFRPSNNSRYGPLSPLRHGI